MSRSKLPLSRQVRTWMSRRPSLGAESLESRDVPSSTLGLTPLVQVSDLSPLATASETPGVHTTNSEVEPQLAVDPTNPSHAVAVYQQDRYAGSGAAALVASVTYDAANPLGATWSTPAAIPGFDSTVAAGSAFQRYTDPWVSIAPNGTVYASAIALGRSGGVPSGYAVLVVKSTDGGATWSVPSTLINNSIPPGTDPNDLGNDKEAVTADPNDPTGQTAYVAWDRLNQPSDEQNFNAYHGFAFRGDALFAKTTDGGATWQTQVTYAPQANNETIGHQILVEPNGDLVDSFSYLSGSGNQPAKAAQNHLAVMRSTDGGATWTAPILGPTLQPLMATNPDTGADIRTGEIIADIAVDPANGNLYQVWADARFSNFKHNDIAFSMSTDGGLTWSSPIKINQTPTAVPEDDQQAFTPSVAVSSDGTVAVTYYDFRNNTATDGVAATDYWLVHASGAFTNSASWATDEKRLTDASFNMTIAPNSRGNFLGDYQGLSAAGTSFYALFGQAGTGASNNTNIWFRDPPPEAAAAAALAASPGVALPAPAVGPSAGPVAVSPVGIPPAAVLVQPALLFPPESTPAGWNWTRDTENLARTVATAFAAGAVDRIAAIGADGSSLDDQDPSGQAAEIPAADAWSGLNGVYVGDSEA